MWCLVRSSLVFGLRCDGLPCRVDACLDGCCCCCRNSNSIRLTVRRCSLSSAVQVWGFCRIFRVRTLEESCKGFRRSLRLGLLSFSCSTRAVGLPLVLRLSRIEVGHRAARCVALLVALSTQKLQSEYAGGIWVSCWLNRNVYRTNCITKQR